jgi:transposase
LTVTGISWVLAYIIAAELGDIERFASPRKLAGYSGLCPRVINLVSGIFAGRSASKVRAISAGR